MTTTRTVAHGLFDYTRTRTVTTTIDGHPTEVETPYIATALRGDVIEVNDGDLERGERLGALVDGDLPTTAAPAPAPPLTPDVSGGSDPTQPRADGFVLDDPSVTANDGPGDHEPPPRPKTVATKAVWVDYAVARGMQREEAEALNKDELIDRLPAES